MFVSLLLFNYKILLFLTFKPVTSGHLPYYCLQMLLRDERCLLWGKKGCGIRIFPWISELPLFFMFICFCIIKPREPIYLHIWPMYHLRRWCRRFGEILKRPWDVTLRNYISKAFLLPSPDCLHILYRNIIIHCWSKLLPSLPISRIWCPSFSGESNDFYPLEKNFSWDIVFGCVCDFSFCFGCYLYVCLWTQ